ncbi:hypothetical protein DL96DRAFT_1817283 [Flagelloscypha sp. PMI_526]|nr:hypothetical protein DL96DRAFT_1817283 [Flagelloscypha sp. PMI_526]
MAVSSSVVLPPEILDKIIVIAADSGGSVITIKLGFICKLFYESAVKRLYHTIHIFDGERLEQILHTSVRLRPGIAPYVQVLNLQTCPRVLMNEALATFTSLRALRIPLSEGFDPAYTLPNLRRFIQLTSANIPEHIARNLTHLYFYGDAKECLSQVARGKSDFQCLTHLLMMDSFSGVEAEVSLKGTLDLLHDGLPTNSFPDSLEVFVLMFRELNYSYLESDKRVMERVQKLLDLDHRVVFWNQEPGGVPLDWNGPRLFDFQCLGLLIEQALNALPDGATGIWENAEQWIRRSKEGRGTFGELSSVRKL